MSDSFGGVVVSATGLVLLREAAGHYGGYAWTFAKGGADPGETPEQAALREVREETGYVPDLLGPFLGSHVGTTGRTSFFLMDAAHPPGPYCKETSALRWTSFDAAPALISETTVEAGRARDLAVLVAARRAWTALPPIARPRVQPQDLADAAAHAPPAAALRVLADGHWTLNPPLFARLTRGVLPTENEARRFAWFTGADLHVHGGDSGRWIGGMRLHTEGQAVIARPLVAAGGDTGHAKAAPDGASSFGPQDLARLVAGR